VFSFFPFPPLPGLFPRVTPPFLSFVKVTEPLRGLSYRTAVCFHPSQWSPDFAPSFPYDLLFLALVRAVAHPLGVCQLAVISARDDN